MHRAARRIPWRAVAAAACVVVLAAPPGAGAASTPLFTDAGAAAGLDFVYFNGMTGAYLFPEIMGGGVALLDYDGDGDLDVYLVQGGLLQADRADRLVFPAPEAAGDRLLRNDLLPGAGGSLAPHFVDVTAAAGIDARGYGMGVASGDYDGDGLPDLYVTNFGTNQLLHNRGDGAFEDVTEATGTGDPGWSVPALFFDFDGDGRLDLYAGDYVEYAVPTDKVCRTLGGSRDYCGPLSYPPAHDRLWRNLGGGRFADVGASSGIGGKAGNSLGAVAADLDGDARPDLYVANDGMANFLWINQGDGSFRDDALLAGAAFNMVGHPEAGMGVACGDYDGDGDDDFLVTHLGGETNTLYRNDGHGLFEDAGAVAGLSTPSWPWTGFGTAWLDVDNDGWLDVLVANGAVHIKAEEPVTGNPYPLAEPNQLYRNLGGGRFVDASAEAGSAFSSREVSRGVAVGDLDGDGDQDVVVVNSASPAQLLIDRVGQRRHWLRLRLLAHPPAGDALGAIVETAGPHGSLARRRVATAGSYASASSPEVVIGRGDEAGPVTFAVRWPDGHRERWTVPVDRSLVLAAGASEAARGGR